MKLSVAGHKLRQGFALPTVLIASVVLLTILAVSVTATTSARTTLKNQYYTQLAQIAGEAGVAYAQACLQASGNVPTWTDAKPLTPSTDCNGDPRAASPQVEVLVVAGGGGGGGNCDTCGGAGGGGGGGVLYDDSFTLTVGSPVTVAVGSGGAGGLELPSRTNGSNGQNSSFGPSMVAIGGGGGGAQLGTAGLNGGSGGGGSGGSSPAPGAGGVGTVGQGRNGGAGGSDFGAGGGGGGGAGGVGVSWTTRAGGAGLAYSISGASLFYGGGGGGGITGTTSSGGPGGSSVGGAGSNAATNSGNGFNGVANRGGGGGGAAGLSTGGNGGAGGSGVVIVRYPQNAFEATGGTKAAPSGGYIVHTFTTGGTFTVTSVPPSLDCPTDERCHVSVDGNVRSSFSVGRPTVDSDGRAVTIPQNGYVELIRESTGAVWRTYRQPTTQPTVAPGLCSGAATSGLGWTTTVLTTAAGSFPEPRAQTIGIASGSVSPGTLFFRKDVSIAEDGTYTIQAKGDGRAIVYIDGKMVARTATNLVTSTVDVDLTAGCHTIGIVAPNGGVQNTTASVQFALRKKDAPLPIVVSDRTWRVATGDTVDWRVVNYFQDNSAGWAPVRDIAAYNASPWTGGPTSWLTITNDASARWISTNHSFSGTNYPFASYAQFRSNNYAAWTFSATTEVQIAAACDDSCLVYVDGNEVLRTSTFGNAGTATVSLGAGSHQVSVELLNTGVANNASALLFSARRTSDLVVIDRSTTAWSASNSWTSTPQSYASYNASYRPSPDVFTCNCSSQGITNFASNPSFETNLDGVTGVNATVVRSSTQAFSGTFSARGTVVSGAQNSYLAIRVNDIEPGVRYRVSGYYYSASGGRFRYVFFDRNGTALVTSTNIESSATNAWTRRDRQTVVAPVGTEYMELRMGLSSDLPAGTVYYVDGIMVTEGTTLRNYADGASPGWLWVETPNASPSSGPIL